MSTKKTTRRPQPQPPLDSRRTAGGRGSNKNRHYSPSFSKAKEMNTKILSLGKQRRIDDLFELFKQECHLFDHVNFATIMIQIQRVGRQRVSRNDPRLKDLLIEIGKQFQNPATAGKWTPRPLANVMHAMSKISSFRYTEARNILDYVENDTVLSGIMQRGAPQAVSNILWAYATQGYESPVVFGAAERHINRVLEEGNPQDIANTLWAYATQGYESPVVFEAAEQQIHRVFEEGNPQAIANTLWAYATQGYESPVVFGAAEQRIHRVFEGGNSQEFANTLWAYAKQGHESPIVFEAAEQHIHRVFEGGNPQDIANTLWAYAKEGCDSPAVFGTGERHIGRVFKDGSSQSIANTLWAYAKQGYDSFAVFEAAEKYIHLVLADGNPQSVANTLWAYAIQGFGNEGHDVDTFRSLWRKAENIPWAEFSDEGKFQLLGSFVMASSEISMHVLPKEWLKNAKMLGGGNSDSKLQTEVSASFNKIGFEHQLEVDPVTKLIPGYLAIDIACSEARIAIEVDGPSHYLRKLRPDNGAAPKENGATKAKRRLLTHLGWKVINIPYFHWDKLKYQRSKEDYLRAVLSKVDTVKW